MQKTAILFLGVMVMMTPSSHGAANVDFSSGKFSSDGQQMTTGQNGHAQATLDAQGSLIRFGSNTVADLGAGREVTLEKGLVLVSSGDGFLRRSGVVIHTPEGQITVRGTVLVAVLPDGAVKLTCLEGSVHGDLGGQSFSLHAGELIIQRGDGSRNMVQVNLHALASTSSLLAGGGFKPLPHAGSIEQAAAQQDKEIAAAQHHGSGQHAAGHGQGESGGFFSRLFSGHGSAANNFSGTVGGATLTLTQGGPANGAVTVSGGTLTMADTSSFRGGASTAGGAVINASNFNPSGAILTSGSTNQQLLLTNSGGTFVQTNNIHTPPEAVVVSGSSLTLSSGVQSSAGGSLSSVITISGNTGGNLFINPVTNINTLMNSLNIANPGDLTLTYNGQVYHGQDALNLINSLQHSGGTLGGTTP